VVPMWYGYAIEAIYIMIGTVLTVSCCLLLARPATCSAAPRAATRARRFSIQSGAALTSASCRSNLAEVSLLPASISASAKAGISAMRVSVPGLDFHREQMLDAYLSNTAAERSWSSSSFVPAIAVSLFLGTISYSGKSCSKSVNNCTRLLRDRAHERAVGDYVFAE
jgi:hypothetical protein